MKNRIISLLMAVVLIFTFAVPAVTPAQAVAGAASTVDSQLQEEVDALLASKHKLTYNADGSFRVMVIADVHMTLRANATNQQAIRDRIALLVDRENPDLVIFTGDNIVYAYDEATLRDCLDNVVGYLEEKQIPWCHVWGNHDEEYGMTKAEQMAIYQSYDYCISKSGLEDITGNGNYVLGVYKADGSLGSVVYCLDSGMYFNNVYDYIREDKIAWYKETSETLQQYNGGKVVPGIMAFHIPLLETQEIYLNREDPSVVTEWDGAKNSPIASSTVDTNLLETILERGDVKAILNGHDHTNTYTLNYKGAVKLAACPTLSPPSMAVNGTEDTWGARILDLNTNTVGTNIPTYISYVVDKNRATYSILPDNATLNYTATEIGKATFTDLSGGAISGTLTMNLVNGKGANGSDAIELVRGTTRANFDITMEITNKGKLGNNKYLKVWVDFTNVDFRKANFGLVSEGVVYNTDKADLATPFYYLADGSTQWQTLSHGADGCFGAGDSGSQSVAGLKGYLAFPIENFRNGSTSLTKDSPITGLYFWGSIKDVAQLGKAFYFDDFRLAVNYATDISTNDTLDTITKNTCTGEVNAYCAICGTEKTWTPLSAISTDTDMGAEEGKHYHYYLTGDVTSSAIYTVQGTLENGSDNNANAQPITVCLNLNGHNVTNTAGTVFKVSDYSVMNILGTGNIIGGATTALMVQTATVNLHGAVTIKMAKNVVASTAVVLVGNSSTSDATSTTPYLYMYDNAVIDGEKTSRGIWLNSSKSDSGVWMYGGTVRNGTGDYGGNIRVQKGVLYIYGGTVNGGTAVNGGNIILNSANGRLVFVDGVISKGTANVNSEGGGGYGGNIWVMNGASVTMGLANTVTNPTVKDGSAEAGGANIALNRAGSSFTMYNGLIDSTESTGSNNGKNIYAFATIDGLYLLGGTINHASSGSNIYVAKNAADVTIDLGGGAKVGQVVVVSGASYPTITVKKGFTGNLTLRHFTQSILDGYGPGCNIPGLFAETDYANTGTIKCTGGNSVTPWAYNGKFYGKANVGVNNYDNNYTHTGLNGSITTVQEALDLYQSKTNPAFVRLGDNLTLLDLSDFEGHVEIGLNKKRIEKLIIGPKAEVEIWCSGTGSVGTIVNNGGTLQDVSHSAAGTTFMLIPTGANGTSEYKAYAITANIKAYLRSGRETLAFQAEVGAVKTSSVSASLAVQLAEKIEDAGIIIVGGNGREMVSFAENDWAIQHGAMTTIRSGSAIFDDARVALYSSNTNWWDQEITAITYIKVNGTVYECRHKTVTYLDAVMALYGGTGENATMVQNMVNNSASKGVYEAYFAENAPTA